MCIVIAVKSYFGCNEYLIRRSYPYFRDKQTVFDNLRFKKKQSKKVIE